MMKTLLCAIALIALNNENLGAQNMNNAYTNEIESWRKSRVERLTSELGWLSVAGLFWLEEGDNKAGSGISNSIHFPKEKSAECVGSFTLQNGLVSFKVDDKAEVSMNNQPYTSGIIFSDTIEEKSMILHHNDLRFYVIKRGSKYGIRMLDLNSDARKNFSGIEHFPIDEKLKIEADWTAPQVNKKIPMLDVIGLTTETPSGGVLNFEINKQHFQLEGLDEGEDLFIVFADETTGLTTYGGGRFLYAKKPINGNKVVLDFNKAYNPPCSFTHFATCPLPPDQNKLKIEIKAGEKKYEKGD